MLTSPAALSCRRLLHTRELHALVKAHDAILLTNAEIGKHLGLVKSDFFNSALPYT
jgi:hypothetical protein